LEPSNPLLCLMVMRKTSRVFIVASILGVISKTYYALNNNENHSENYSTGEFFTLYSA